MIYIIYREKSTKSTFFYYYKDELVYGGICKNHPPNKKAYHDYALYKIKLGEEPLTSVIYKIIKINIQCSVRKLACKRL